MYPVSYQDYWAASLLHNFAAQSAAYCSHYPPHPAYHHATPPAYSLDSLVMVAPAQRAALQPKSPNPTARKQSTLGASAGAKSPSVVDLTKPAQSTATKRGAPEPEEDDDEGSDSIDDDDPRLHEIKWDCNQVRRMIRNLIENGDMKIGKFCDAIGNSQNSYRTFMGMSGKDKGSGSDTYANAHLFFRKRELKGIAPPRKKTKTKTSSTATAAKGGKKAADPNKWDVSGVELEEYGHLEAKNDVPIFETCDSVRRMINAHLRTTDESQAALARHFSTIMGKKIQGGQISSFLGKKGPRSGAESPAFYAGYVYFEKLRIKQGKKKGAFREEMERLWRPAPKGEMGVGVPRQDSSRISLFGTAGFAWNFDKYGIIQTNGRR